MTFDEWWEEYKSENRQFMYMSQKETARVVWEAAKQDTIDELNESVKKAWPEDVEQGREEAERLLRDACKERKP